MPRFDITDKIVKPSRRIIKQKQDEKCTSLYSTRRPKLTICYAKCSLTRLDRITSMPKTTTVQTTSRRPTHSGQRWYERWTAKSGTDNDVTIASAGISHHRLPCRPWFNNGDEYEWEDQRKYRQPRVQQNQNDPKHDAANVDVCYTCMNHRYARLGSSLVITASRRRDICLVHCIQ